MTNEAQAKRIIMLNTVFTPAAPIDKKDLFAGRIEQIESVYEAIPEKGRHVLIYGERGVGKTSLANIINELLPNRYVVKISCDTSDSFSSIWHKILRRIYFATEQIKIGFGTSKEIKSFSLNGLFPSEKKITPDDVIIVFRQFSEWNIIIIDEFDRVIDVEAKRLMADTIKTLSDSIPNVTMVLVGVAQSVSQLIGEHPSIERNIKQILLQRMSSRELEEIINKGLDKINMNMDPQVKEKVVKFSQGFPHYTHLLAKHSAKQAINQDREKIIQADFDLAIEDAINDTLESIRNAYQKGTIATKKAIFREVLLACALVDGDEHGTFRATDLEKYVSKIIGKPYATPGFAYNLGKLCLPERGSILEKVGTPKRYRYRFTNPLMKPFILLMAYNAGIINENWLDIK